MIGKFTERLRAEFAAKFSVSGDTCIYRRTRDSKPVIISTKDHAFLIDDFDRRLSAFTTVSIGVVVVVIVGAIGIALGDFPPGAAFVVLTAIFSAALWFDLWDTPEIAFYQRLVDRGEHKKIPHLNREALGRSWSSIIFGALFFAFLTAQHATDDAPDWWDRIMIVVFVVGIAYIVLIAIVKASSYTGSRYAHLYQRN